MPEEPLPSVSTRDLVSVPPTKTGLDPGNNAAQCAKLSSSSQDVSPTSTKSGKLAGGVIPSSENNLHNHSGDSNDMSISQATAVTDSVLPPTAAQFSSDSYSTNQDPKSINDNENNNENDNKNNDDNESYSNNDQECGSSPNSEGMNSSPRHSRSGSNTSSSATTKSGVKSSVTESGLVFQRRQIKRNESSLKLHSTSSFSSFSSASNLQNMNMDALKRNSSNEGSIKESDPRLPSTTSNPNNNGSTTNLLSLQYNTSIQTPSVQTPVASSVEIGHQFPFKDNIIEDDETGSVRNGSAMGSHKRVNGLSSTNLSQSLLRRNSSLANGYESGKPNIPTVSSSSQNLQSNASSAAPLSQSSHLQHKFSNSQTNLNLKSQHRPSALVKSRIPRHLSSTDLLFPSLSQKKQGVNYQPAEVRLEPNLYGIDGEEPSPHSSVVNSRGENLPRSQLNIQEQRPHNHRPEEKQQPKFQLRTQQQELQQYQPPNQNQQQLQQNHQQVQNQYQQLQPLQSQPQQQESQLKGDQLQQQQDQLQDQQQHYQQHSQQQQDHQRQQQDQQQYRQQQYQQQQKQQLLHQQKQHHQQQQIQLQLQQNQQLHHPEEQQQRHLSPQVRQPQQQIQQQPQSQSPLSVDYAKAPFASSSSTVPSSSQSLDQSKTPMYIPVVLRSAYSYVNQSTGSKGGNNGGHGSPDSIKSSQSSSFDYFISAKSQDHHNRSSTSLYSISGNNPHGGGGNVINSRDVLGGSIYHQARYPNGASSYSSGLSGGGGSNHSHISSPTKSHWVSDASRKFCKSCDKPFLFLSRRRHHCRKCGEIFCNDCSRFFIKMDSQCRYDRDGGLNRCCETCAKELSSLDYGFDDNRCGQHQHQKQQLRLRQPPQKFLPNDLHHQGIQQRGNDQQPNINSFSTVPRAISRIRQEEGISSRNSNNGNGNNAISGNNESEHNHIYNGINNNSVSLYGQNNQNGNFMVGSIAGSVIRESGVVPNNWSWSTF
ncbi:hypothetical protein NADFUDRAFT_81170 [Nadsonia fulvescens var. elongata DSM 6958]|uniref:FYVE-type domain-containing protein n=1 Tax=Nadsonia fulvescens var. elongata DSM 6958 TaxID=857566 RepID=A0A1E3PS84_9ASCO|nr:hypothetical protein NADFUDRAFT_81170 [Nadsonia fulvescens var. elongata DSM 6958]